MTHAHIRAAVRAGVPNPSANALDLARRGELAEAIRPALERIARARLRDAHHAEDVVSDAIERCLGFEALDLDRIGAFLTAVTIRLCVDHSRRQAAESRAIQRLCALKDVSEIEPYPDDQVCDVAAARQLHALTRTLTEREQQILDLVTAGLTQPEIAARLNVTTKAVECALRRARQRLRHLAAVVTAE